jgi:hypothetical protein
VGGLFLGGRVDAIHLMTQSRLVSIALVFIDGSFFDRSIDNGKRLRQKLLSCLPVVALDGLSECFDLGPQQRSVVAVDRFSFETSPPLSKGGLVISHFSLLKRNVMIKYLFFYVKCSTFRRGQPGMKNREDSN